MEVGGEGDYIPIATLSPTGYMRFSFYSVHLMNKMRFETARSFKRRS